MHVLRQAEIENFMGHEAYQPLVRYAERRAQEYAYNLYRKAGRRLSRYAAGKVQAMVKRGLKRKKSSSSSSWGRKRGKSSSGSGSAKPTPTSRGNATITRQHDLRTTFSRRRPSRKYKRLRKFASKVRKAQTLNSPLHIGSEATSGLLIMATGPVNTRNLQFSLGHTPSSMTDLRLMAVNATGWNALHQALLNAPIDQAGDIARSSTANQLRFWAQQRMDLALENISGVAILLDIYICRAAQDIPAFVPHSSAVNAWSTCLSETQSLSGIPPYVSLASPIFAGVTPFDAPSFGKWWTIVSKQRIEIQPGEVISTSIAPKGYNITTAKWEGKNVKKGITHDVILTACPTYNSFPPNTSVLQIQWAKLTKMRMPGLFQGTQMSFTGAVNVT